MVCSLPIPGLGKELAESWIIPAKQIEAIAFHHAPMSSDLDTELSSLVHIGDVCARNLRLGSGDESYTTVIDPFAVEHLEVSEDDLIGSEEELSQVTDKDMAFLAAIV